MYRAIKYLVDVAITLAGSIMILPLSALVALSLWLTQERVLFRQRRPGLHGKPFTLYKFCTMTNAQDKNGKLLPDEQRITKIGALVRNLSLDELPQFWNVIKGEMSLVGPRPLLMEYLTRYTPEEARRHDVTPGITGWAQVNGRNAISWETKFALDVWYVDHASFFLDLRILWITCLRVIRRSGISNQGHATMPQFMGNKSEN
jgi:lipopolysaccharide/colanic/teichoic acid biosynthesis glycosyltransferase